ncbi:hypothetical protein FRC12_013615 [Ceratobasidium sp. 428]|nr:hypothetical protein FRC12_013615 [Ceratobasidium sp. 428]
MTYLSEDTDDMRLDFSGVLYNAPTRLRDFAKPPSPASTITWKVTSTSTKNGQDNEEIPFKFPAVSGDFIEEKIGKAIGELMTRVSLRDPQRQPPPKERSKLSFLNFGARSASRPTTPASEAPTSFWTVHIPGSLDQSDQKGWVRKRVEDYEKRAGWRI